MKKGLLILLVITGYLQSQNVVSGTFTPAENYSFAFIYKATSNGATFIDRSKLDSSGNFSIQLDSTQQPGIYKVVYAVPPEENNFDFIYDAKENVSFIFNGETGIEFTASNENKLWSSYIKSMGMINQTISNYYLKDGKDVTAFNEIFKTLKETQEAYEASAKGMLALDLIKANKPYIPQKYEDISQYSRRLKETFFDNIDFDNEFLQSSSFITDRINGYMFNMSDDASDEDYMNRVNDIASALKSSQPTTQLFLFHLLWEEFVQLNNDVLSTYITDNYLLELATQNNQSELADRLLAQKRIAIGNKAPDFNIETGLLSTTMHQLPKDLSYLLIFWSSSCSHCLEEVPQVHELLKHRSDVKVIAYGLEDNAAQWEERIKELPGFIHVIGSKKWDSPIVKEYSLNATPTYFLLNGEKTIVQKPYNLEELRAAIMGL